MWKGSIFSHWNRKQFVSLWKIMDLIKVKDGVCNFLTIFYFSPNYSPSKTMRCFLFHLKNSFHSWDIQVFLCWSSLLFLPVSDCLRAWSKINLNVYEVTSCLNKSLITHFVWYIEKEERYDIETLSIDRVLNKKHFYGKIMQEMCIKS